MLEMNHLTKFYGRFKAVDDVTLHVHSGEIHGFIGHNGAGKTTTLKCIAGILPYDKGSIHIHGVDVQMQPIQAKKIMAYIPDNPDLYDYLTGIQYLNFICDAYRVDKNIRMQRIEELATLFEIFNDLGQPVHSYSHGMKQKLAVISAFVHAPKLIIMDEPFVGLDPKASYQLKQLMHQHCNQGGAIFFSTHVLEVAEKLCDHISIIKNGQMIVSGKTEVVTKDESLEKLFLELENDYA
ncbi:MAG: ABC transporter ATP-binding protein [Erysipelotrichaceae bacterium]|nr:ABC transporter ATP-binding protein [Erysipelotrichaceae bacterium]